LWLSGLPGFTATHGDSRLPCENAKWLVFWSSDRGGNGSQGEASLAPKWAAMPDAMRLANVRASATTARSVTRCQLVLQQRGAIDDRNTRTQLWHSPALVCGYECGSILCRVRSRKSRNKRKGNLLMRSFLMFCAVTMALIVTPVFSADLILNGSFEDGKAIPSDSGYTAVSLPSTDLPGLGR
jgi:hypothetical protein